MLTACKRLFTAWTDGRQSHTRLQENASDVKQEIPPAIENIPTQALVSDAIANALRAYYQTQDHVPAPPLAVSQQRISDINLSIVAVRLNQFYF